MQGLQHPYTASRKSTKRYYLGGAIIYGSQGQAAHRNNAPQTPRCATNSHR